MSSRCLQFLPTNKRKQVELIFHSIKVEFILRFLEETLAWKNPFQLCLTFTTAGFVHEPLNNKVDTLATDPVGKLGIKPFNSKWFQLCLPPQIFGPSTGPILSFWRYVLLLKLPKLGQTILYLNTQWTIFSMIVQKTQAICNYISSSCYKV